MTLNEITGTHAKDVRDVPGPGGGRENARGTRGGEGPAGAAVRRGREAPGGRELGRGSPPPPAPDPARAKSPAEGAGPGARPRGEQRPADPGRLFAGAVLRGSAGSATRPLQRPPLRPRGLRWAARGAPGPDPNNQQAEEAGPARGGRTRQTGEKGGHPGGDGTGGGRAEGPARARERGRRRRPPPDAGPFPLPSPGPRVSRSRRGGGGSPVPAPRTPRPADGVLSAGPERGRGRGDHGTREAAPPRGTGKSPGGGDRQARLPQVQGPRCPRD